MFQPYNPYTPCSGTILQLQNQLLWQKQNLQNIQKRLQPVIDVENLSEAIETEFQGLYLRRNASELELFCYNIETKDMSGIMSRMDLFAPMKMVSPYGQAAFTTAFWNDAAPLQIYLAGFGGGRLATVFHHYFPTTTIHGSDIDPNMLEVAQAYFGLELDERLVMNIDDSLADLHTKTELFDVIILDTFFGSGNHANHLATVEFLELCKHKMHDNGIIAANLVKADPTHERKIGSFRETFEHSYLWKHKGAILVIGSDKQMDDDFVPRAAGFETLYNLDFPVSEQAASLEALASLSKQPALWDADLPNMKVLADT